MSPCGRCPTSTTSGPRMACTWASTSSKSAALVKSGDKPDSGVKYETGGESSLILVSRSTVPSPSTIATLAGRRAERADRDALDVDRKVTRRRRPSNPKLKIERLPGDVLEIGAVLLHLLLEALPRVGPLGVGMVRFQPRAEFRLGHRPIGFSHVCFNARVNHLFLILFHAHSAQGLCSRFPLYIHQVAPLPSSFPPPRFSLHRHLLPFSAY